MSSNLILNNAGIFWDYLWSVAPTFHTDISALAGGGEQRRARWEFPLRHYKLPFAFFSIRKRNHHAETGKGEQEMIFGFCGTLGSGKGTAIELLQKEYGAISFSLSDEIREECRSRGLGLERTNLSKRYRFYLSYRNYNSISLKSVGI